MAKLCAEYLKNTQNQMFKMYLDDFKALLLQLRDGLSVQVLEFLSNPSLFELRKIEIEEGNDENTRTESTSETPNPATTPRPQSARASASFTTSPEESSSSATSSARSFSSSKVHLEEVPIHLQDAMQLDCLVKSMPGDGACLYYCGADLVLGGWEHMETLRKQGHRFIVENWDYYRRFISLPFVETIGVGAAKRTVTKKTYDDMKKCLLSNESIYCYSNSYLYLTW